MDLADWIVLLFPQWLLMLIAFGVFVLSVDVWRCRARYLVDSHFFLAIGLGMFGIGAFYVGAVIGYEDTIHAIAASRAAFMLLFVTIGAVLISIRCKKSETGNGTS